MKKVIRRIFRWLSLIPQQGIERRDLQKIEIQANLYFLVYWKELSIGKGPAVTLNAFDKEILKFDCFGKEKGHFHIYPYEQLRIFFTEDNARSQCDRTFNEITCNGARYIKQFPNRAIKELDVDHEKLEEAAMKARKIMISFLEEIDVLQDL